MKIKKLFILMVSFSVGSFSFLSQGRNTNIKNNKSGIVNATVFQDNNFTGRGNDNEVILKIRISASGSKTAKLTSLTINMDGTTDVNDVETIKIYLQQKNEDFDSRNPLKTAKLLGSALPSKENIKVRFSPQALSDSAFIFLTYKIKETAKEGNKVDASVVTAATNNGFYEFQAGNPDGAREILLRRTLVFAPNDFGSRNYRIPAITTAADGSLVILTDKRKYNGTDLPEDIDIVARRSTDGGVTWSKPVTVAQGTGYGKGFGDALLMKAKSGKLVTLFVGGPGLWGSTPQKPQRTYVSSSFDNGVTWSAPRDITSQIYSIESADSVRSKWISLFFGSGHGLTTKSGRLMGVIAVRELGMKGLQNYAVYSDDEGENWKVSERAILNGDEAKVIELNNGDILMSSRQPEAVGNRLWAKSSDSGITWGERNTWSEIWGARCDADIVRLTSSNDGFDRNRILHTLPNYTSRKNVTMWLSYDEGTTWPVKKTICPHTSGYSSITILPDGTIGVYLEEDEMSNYKMYFLNFSLDWLTNGADSYELPK
ncbi:MAG: exo-alpha-sialidase [Paludibacteraceae bacterium]